MSLSEPAPRCFVPGLFKDDGTSVVLTGGRCQSCGQPYFPAPAVCLKCGASDMREIELGPEGAIFSFTTVHMSVSGVKPPYSAGYVVLTPGVRVFGQIDPAPARPLAVGQCVRATSYVMRHEAEGDIVGYRFAVIPESE